MVKEKKHKNEIKESTIKKLKYALGVVSLIVFLIFILEILIFPLVIRWILPLVIIMLKEYLQITNPIGKFFASSTLMLMGFYFLKLLSLYFIELSDNLWEKLKNGI